MTDGRDPSIPRKSAAETTGSAAAGLALLLFGALFTAIEVGVGGEKNTDFAAWTSTTVGYLLLVALGAQTVLVVLSWLMRRNFPAGAPLARPRRGQ
jgi:hypothetical protein